MNDGTAFPFVIFALLFATYAIMIPGTAGGPTGKQLFDLDNAAIETVLGKKAQFVCSPGTYDQKHIDRIGRLKNCIAYGPGLLHLAHQPDEWVGVQDMEDSALVMALVLADLLAA